ncbi:MAG: glycosyltransferase [Acidimicrobiales bacterium]
MTPAPEPGAIDLAVVIPTRDRPEVLGLTLDALDAQSAPGFETIVVVDGLDQGPLGLPDRVAGTALRTVVKAHAGPGAARNAGAQATTRPLLLFLGDDMVPTPGLVARHLEVHRRDPAAERAVLGGVGWHPELRSSRLVRWLDWSGTQFEFASIAGKEAGFGHFYSCNVSLKRSLFLAAGGFDEDFTYYYEDLDLGWRLAERGLRLAYEPDARANHLHDYDWPGLEQRVRGLAQGERLMARKHAWFEPHFAERARRALVQRRVGAWWPLLADRVDIGPVRRLGDRWYWQQLGPTFLDAWDGARDLEELRAYLGAAYDHTRLQDHEGEVAREAAALGDEAALYRSSEAYLYDLTAFAMSATKSPYLADLRRLVAPGASLLDYGCGIGSDGLRLLEGGYRVAFADFDNPSTRYLKWRLERRGHEASVYDLDSDEVPGGFDAAYAFDVLEHVDDPFELLDRLERRAALVMVNLLEHEGQPVGAHHADVNHALVHRELPMEALLDHARRAGLLHQARYHGRSLLVAYRSPHRPRGRWDRSPWSGRTRRPPAATSR